MSSSRKIKSRMSSLRTTLQLWRRDRDGRHLRNELEERHFSNLLEYSAGRVDRYEYNEGMEVSVKRARRTVVFGATLGCLNHILSPKRSHEPALFMRARAAGLSIQLPYHLRQV